jgi:hypothetical protein
MRNMNWKTFSARVVTVSAAGLLHVAPAHAADVSVGVNIGIPVPPPPVVIATPPQVVIVPGSPVYYAPSVGFNLFVYHGRYYRFHEGHWFIATAHGGPWAFVARDKVPQPVLAVPVTYYKIPPGQAKKISGPDFNDRGPKGKRGKHD